mmetsp:Transcript_24069/g.65155  ORF Transcript_24069/g.65155 Transcript_24069/m.65155 type:complete len:250 (-) Transcript_24069:916-1665(-)
MIEARLVCLGGSATWWIAWTLPACTSVISEIIPWSTSTCAEWAQNWSLISVRALLDAPPPVFLALVSGLLLSILRLSLPTSAWFSGTCLKAFRLIISAHRLPATSVHGMFGLGSPSAAGSSSKSWRSRLQRRMMLRRCKSLMALASTGARVTVAKSNVIGCVVTCLDRKSRSSALRRYESRSGWVDFSLLSTMLRKELHRPRSPVPRGLVILPSEHSVRWLKLYVRSASANADSRMPTLRSNGFDRSRL